MDNLLVDIREAGGSIEVEAGDHAGGTHSRVGLPTAHFIVVFEPGDAQAFRVGLEVSPTLSPPLSRLLQYDDIEDRFDIVIAGNETPFGGYYELFCHSRTCLRETRSAAVLERVLGCRSLAGRQARFGSRSWIKA